VPSLPHGSKVEAIPPALLKETGAPRFVKMCELEANQVGTDAAAVQNDLEANGYALVAAQVRLKERSPKKR
jgi:uncharacterized protein YcgL (UPF0745 family)